MSIDIKNLTAAYAQMIDEAVKPLAVKKNAKGKGEVGGLQPGELPSDTKSADAKQEDSGATGSKTVKEVEKPEEAEERLSPRADKVTKESKPEKKVTKIQDSTNMKKSFMDLYSEIIKEEAPDIESNDFDSDMGDFPPAEGEEGYGDEEGGMEEQEGDTFSQLADIFSQASELFRKMATEHGGGAMEDEVPDAGMNGTEGMEGTPEMAGESTIAEMKSEPEPKEFTGKDANFSGHQYPNKLARSGVKTSAHKKAAVKGNGQKRTGELQDAPEGFKHDKSKMKVQGSGSASKGNNASFMED